MLTIRPVTRNDEAAIWSIIRPVIREGETYALPVDMSETDALRHWTGPDREAFIVEEGGVAVGTYYIRSNQAGGGAHIANCGYMTHEAARGRGVARRMCEHSLRLAPQRGFRAMQFNFVISSNERAVRLWRSLGFATIGRLPLVFRRPAGEYVDAFVMFRTL